MSDDSNAACGAARCVRVLTVMDGSEDVGSLTFRVLNDVEEAFAIVRAREAGFGGDDRQE